MADCGDKRYRGMLHAYELDMLTDDERRDLEMHLLDCPSCRRELLEFHNNIVLLHRDTEVRDAVRETALEEESASGESIDEASAPRRRRVFPALVPTAVVALVVALVLVMQPWKIQINPDQVAVATENRLAIMYFENVADPADSLRLGEILTNLLITDLAESRYINVVSSQRLYDILKLLGKEDAKLVSSEMATQVAERAGAQFMLMGSILQVTPQLVVTAQLVEVGSGNVVASQRITGKPGEKIFAVIDDLSVEIRRDLSLPAAAQQEWDRPVAEVTTSSPEAYRLYIEGLDYLNKLYATEASQKFKKALAYDSTFAMVYYYLSHVSSSEGLDLMEKANEYIDKAGHKDRYLIRSRKYWIEGNHDEAIYELEKLIKEYGDEKLAYYYLGEYYHFTHRYDLSIKYLKKAIEIDPLDKKSLNMLAYSYLRSEIYDKALETINTYLTLYPDEANPYDSRGDIYFSMGDIQRAIESYKQAIRVKPDFHASVQKIAFSYLRLQNYEEARKSMNQYIALMSGKSSLLLRASQFSYFYFFEGKLDSVMALAETNIQQQIDSLGEEKCNYCRRIKTLVHIHQENWDAALSEMEKERPISKRLSPMNVLGSMQLKGYILALRGDAEGTHIMADSILGFYKDTALALGTYNFVKAMAHRIEGDMEAAIDLLKKSRKGPIYSFLSDFWLARTLLDAGYYEQAAMAFEGIPRANVEFTTPWSCYFVESYYYAGVTYEKLGQTGKAIEKYKTMIDIWKNADYEFKTLIRARENLARLKSGV